MSLLDSLTQWIDKDRESLSYIKIESSNVDRPQSPESLKAGVHYFRLRLASMFLKKETAWFSSWYPAVHSLVRFNFGDHTIEVPNIADPTIVGMESIKGGDVIARNFLLTPTIPFNGGIISLSAGLFALEGQNYLAKVLKVLGNFSGLLNVTQLSLALNIVQPLALGIQELFGGGNGHMHLSLHDSFSEGELKSGYIAAIRAPQNSVNPADLMVVNDELHHRKSEPQRFTSHDHMLFRIELFDKRDDWESLTSIQEPFQEALTALRNQSEAAHYMRTALLRATLSPDLTTVDKRRVVDRLIEKYDEAKQLLSFSFAVGDEIPTLEQAMKSPMPVKMALGRGEPTVSEIFSTVRDDSPGREKANGPTRELPLQVGGDTAGRDIFLESSRVSGEGIDDPKGAPFEVTIDRDIVVGKPLELTESPRPVLPESPAPAGAEPVTDPVFYFATRGDGVRGDRVKLGAAFDLIFNHGIPIAPVMATASGSKLEELLKVEKADLDIVVFPRGLILKESNKWKQRATFINGVIEKEIVFPFQAPDELTKDCSIYVMFERNGAVLYEFPIALQLTETLDTGTNLADFSPLEFDLDELAAAATREQRTARLLIFADGDKLSVTFDNLATDESFQVDPKLLTRSSLADILGKTKTYLDTVPNHTIWTVLEDSLARPGVGTPGEKAFKYCLDRVASAGWSLYRSLAADEDMRKVLTAIDDLPPSSSLSIRTDCAFLPWEILNPSDFNVNYSDAIKDQNPVQPQNFWGNRLSIECLLAGQNQKYKTPTSIHETSPAYVSMNIYRTIDKDFTKMKVLPGMSHNTLSAELAPSVKTDVRQKGDDILRVFDTLNYEATLIYLFCHGQNDKALDPNQSEKLEVDEQSFVAPMDLPPKVKYPRGPIVFLNSCSSGAFSPLAFSTFLRAFREKQALGLIATSFPVPITFGSAFGQELMRRYFKNNQPMGQALFELRREQLANGNPLGLFYSLQCPADIIARTH